MFSSYINGVNVSEHGTFTSKHKRSCAGQRLCENSFRIAFSLLITLRQAINHVGWNCLAAVFNRTHC